MEFTKEQINEYWNDIPGYENAYQVSSYGNVRSLDKSVKCINNTKRTVKGKILTQRINPEGRYYVTLSQECKRKTFKVHKLVAMAFLNHIPCGYKEVVDHVNNNPLDNRLSNLQLISARENTSKDRKNKTSKYQGVWFCKTTQKWKSEIRINGKRFNLGAFSIEEHARDAYLNKLQQI